MDIVVIVVGIAAGVSLFTWVASLITGDHSWVDRIWSIVPIVYVAAFWAATGFSDPRLLIMTVLVLLWGARLTFNFARKGGYSGVEDYRWPILRARMSPGQFQVFNLLFIVIVQNALLLLIALPALVAFQNQATPIGPVDLVLAAVFLTFLVGEFVADQQQWDFHRAKAATIAAGARPSRASSPPGCGDSAATPTSSSSRRNGGCSTRWARSRSARRCTGRSWAPYCSPHCSSARPSSPSRSRVASTPSTPSTSVVPRC